MSVATPLLQTIESDEPISLAQPKSSTPHEPVVLMPTSRAQSGMASTPGGAESGSAHPISLLFLYLFRIAAITTYILCGFFTDNYVISTVAVVVLLAMDFWNCRNVSGRTLVGLRFWNQVDDDGESYWVFESRDPSRPANPIDSKMFWTALYVFPALWLVLFIVSLLKFNLSFVPIVLLALVFNMTNVIGFTYADRDAKQKWAANVATSGWNMGMGGIGNTILTGVVKSSVGRVFGA
ncbi:hypothetical protein HETIRDRAFT_307763 [Heterobasidion irregulare TC 32-1]|uniref:Golgi apparatus membrane protein TVP23 n=1 Tax=Heterobasidion irregulare (strain TC 32-1) TaxID=747525 RepID=W4KPX7_HETIT|nr:uncharacterized protein HETIRDRAFT_307763 [Heterobasidion irregulare TC 32-1]ETW87445.1 hypothetical protein HETIRDRAFT_307763 [Heterobasidion irregulare TC 32-1]